MFQSWFRSKTQLVSSKVQQISAFALYERMQAGEALFFIDVRTPGEYEYDGHIVGSRLLPLAVLPHRIDELPKGSTIVCISRSGARSHTAAEQLLMKGFEDVVNLSGGMIGWRHAGLPYQ
jgi:adenylyltransferase/sulfurtransferase